MEGFKSYWCPFARVLSVNHKTSYNRTAEYTPSDKAMCIGPKCMAYRYTSGNNIGYCGLVGSAN